MLVRDSGWAQIGALALGALVAAPAGAGFNEDTNLDVVFANTTVNFLGLENRVCLGDGMAPPLFGCSNVSGDVTGSFGVAVGDVNGDGHLDAVFADQDTSPVGQVNLVCLGDGSGSLSACSAVGADADDSESVALGDLNRDGNLDAVFANDTETGDTGGQNRVCLGDGMGGFGGFDASGMPVAGGTECADVSPVGDRGQVVALGDANNDGHPDAVFAIAGGANLVCLGNGDGTFGMPGAECGNVAGDTFVTRGVALGDVDTDGNLDAVFANDGDTDRLCLGDGAGGFTCDDVSAETNGSFFVALGDVDGDGHLDAVFANADEANRLCLGDGMGGFGGFGATGDECGAIDAPARSFGVALGFVDDDGHLDAVFANTPTTGLSGENQVCLGDGMTPPAFTCSNVSMDTNASRAVAATDTDLDGAQDNLDVCVPSDLRSTVFIRGTDTGVPNPLTDTTVPTLFPTTLGCTVADLIEESADLAINRTGFLNSLQLVLRALVMDGTLAFSEAQTLRIAAAESSLP